MRSFSVVLLVVTLALLALTANSRDRATRQLAIPLAGSLVVTDLVASLTWVAFNGGHW